MKQRVLATILPVTQIIQNEESIINVSGILALIQRSPFYYLTFRKDNSSNVSQTPNYSIFSNFKEDPNDIICSNIIKMTFTELNSETDCSEIPKSFVNKENLLLKISFSSQDSNINTLLYVLQTQKMIEISLFVQELISHGIALPLFPTNQNYELIFYKFSNDHFFYTVPSHLQITHFTFTSLNSFWNDVIEFYRQLIQFLFDCDCLRTDNNYKLGMSADSMLIPIKNAFSDFIKKLDHYHQIKKEEFEGLYDDQGKLFDPENFKKRLFAAGCEYELLPQVIPYAVGIYKYDSTKSERMQIDEQLKRDYLKLTDQVESIAPQQISRHKKLRDSFRVIVQDAERTDRMNKAFKYSNKGGMSLLIRLLRCYCLYDQHVSYLQGMNDLFVPIILAYLPNWDDEGNPVDSNGNIIDDIIDYESHIFWCFTFLIEQLNHTTLLANITNRSIQISHIVVSLLFQIEPLISLWLMKNNLIEFFWMYSDFVYLFKRSFQNIWDIWFQFTCSPSPKTWLVYFIAVIVIEMFNTMSAKTDFSITELMEAYPQYIESCNKSEIGKKALYLYENYPLESFTYVSAELDIAQTHDNFPNLKKEENLTPDMQSFQFCEFDIS